MKLKIFLGENYYYLLKIRLSLQKSDLFLFNVELVSSLTNFTSFEKEISQEFLGDFFKLRFQQHLRFQKSLIIDLRI